MQQAEFNKTAMHRQFIYFFANQDSILPCGEREVGKAVLSNLGLIEKIFCYMTKWFYYTAIKNYAVNYCYLPCGKSLHSVLSLCRFTEPYVREPYV